MTLSADHRQFCLQDERADGDPADRGNEQAVEDMSAFAPGTIGVVTARNTEVPALVAVHAARPTFEGEGRWDRICEADIDVPTGRIVVAGCTDSFPDVARIAVAPGSYRARVQLTGDGLAGDDQDRIDLWPGTPEGKRVIKRRR